MAIVGNVTLSFGEEGYIKESVSLNLEAGEVCSYLGEGGKCFLTPADCHWKSRSIYPMQTKNYAALVRDFFLPNLANTTVKTENLFYGVGKVIFLFFLDIVTLPIRCFTLLPRMITDRGSGNHPLQELVFKKLGRKFDPSYEHVDVIICDVNNEIIDAKIYRLVSTSYKIGIREAFDRLSLEVKKGNYKNKDEFLKKISLIQGFPLWFVKGVGLDNLIRVKYIPLSRLISSSDKKTIRDRISKMDPDILPAPCVLTEYQNTPLLLAKGCVRDNTTTKRSFVNVKGKHVLVDAVRVVNGMFQSLGGNIFNPFIDLADKEQQLPQRELLPFWNECCMRNVRKFFSECMIRRNTLSASLFGCFSEKKKKLVFEPSPKDKKRSFETFEELKKIFSSSDEVKKSLLLDEFFMRNWSKKREKSKLVDVEVF